MSEKKYKEIHTEPGSVADAALAYGDINALKVQLVNRIMRMDAPKELLSVLDFVKNQTNDGAEFESEWNRGLSVEAFRARCKDKLKEIYAGN